MKLAEIYDCPKRGAFSEKGIAPRISEIIKACECSKNLLICIYMLEMDRFLYCNQGVKNLVGEKSSRLLDEGWNYWFSRIDSSEVVWARDKIAKFFAYPIGHEVLTLRYHIMKYDGKRICVKHEIFLYQIEKASLAINYFFDISDKERIENYFKEIKDLENSYFAISPYFHISAREKEVLHLIADGYSSKEIADILFISNHTAISHRKNLIEKFQVKNTAQLIKKASQLIQL